MSTLRLHCCLAERPCSILYVILVSELLLMVKAKDFGGLDTILVLVKLGERLKQAEANFAQLASHQGYSLFVKLSFRLSILTFFLWFQDCKILKFADHMILFSV